MTDPAPAPQSASSAALRLLPMVLPGVVVGVASALVLIAVTVVANGLEDVLWSRIPDALGVDPAAPLWIIGILTLTGLAVGLVVTFVPGHAGPDPATVELGGPPLAIGVLPGLALAAILALAGGVSLGPENPLVGINVGLAVAIGLRVLPRVPGPAWGGLAFAGTHRGDVRDADRRRAPPQRVDERVRATAAGTACSGRWSRPRPAR